VLGVAIAIGIWEVAAGVGWVDPNLLTPPSGFVPAWWGMARSGELWEHVLWTCARIGTGCAIGCTFGFILAIICHLAWVARALTAHLVEIFRALPALALLPAFLLLFGIGFKYPVAIIVWVSWVPVFLSTLDGLDTVDPHLDEAAALDGAPAWARVWYILVPVASPQILVGLRLSLGVAFISVIAAELQGSTVGVGYFILDASSTFRIPEMYAMIATLGVVALGANWLLVRLVSVLWPYCKEN
jgi:ABC-type nitrate/sulfonate/bicarbonate transport system permease component